MLILASDHAGFPLKEEIKAYLDERNKTETTEGDKE